jgi:stage II sporulation protein D
MNGMRRLLPATLLCILATVFAPAAASAAGGYAWKIDGAGFGHGVGLSQYGSEGFARHGYDWRRIIAHYYRGTTIGPAPAGDVRVLLLPGAPSVSFAGAASACGVALDEGKTYVAAPAGDGIAISASGGKDLGTCNESAMDVAGGVSFTLAGKGEYRGTLKLLDNGSGGLDAVNTVGIDDYVRGVVANESPSDWHPQALRAQAVAARSYALATATGGGSFDLYDDTRSQVYGGVGTEQPTTDAATAKTAGLVVLHGGEVATTFFFSTSGGHTEDSENVFEEALPYVRGVPDPYDDGSRYHRWRETMSTAAMDSALAGLADGHVTDIRVTKTGASPRIVEAEVVSTGGTTTVSGQELQSALGLRDRWASFRLVPLDQRAKHASERLARAFTGRW